MVAQRKREEEFAANAPNALHKMEAPETDAELVQRAQRDPQAFGEVFRQYHRDVYVYCFRRLGRPERADDAAQMVFVKAFAALDRFRPERGRGGVTFRSWLFAIAHNVVVDAWRKERHHLPLEGPGEGEARFVDPTASPEDQALGAEETRRVTALLARLPERQRAVVELRLAGLSTTEVAHSLGMSLPAAKSAQFRAYSALRDLLRDDPGAISREIPR